MKLSVTSWSFPQCSFKEAVGISSLLNINAIDISYFYRSALDKELLLQDHKKIVDQINKYEIDYSNLYHLFGNSLEDRNLADTNNLKDNVTDLTKVTDFCVDANIPSIFVLPGMINNGQSRKEALKNSIESLKTLNDITSKKNIQLLIEPHVHSYLESPEITLELLDAVPGLKLALDYAHFVCLGWTQESIDVLAEYSGHVHLRQAKSGFLQTKLEEGTINFNAVFGKLKEVGYNDYLSIEYVHQNYMMTVYDDVLSETIKMRDLYNTWKGK
jgi:sugar phosphate isomerase/epimerase